MIERHKVKSAAKKRQECRINQLSCLFCYQEQSRFNSISTLFCIRIIFFPFLKTFSEDIVPHNDFPKKVRNKFRIYYMCLPEKKIY